MEILYYPCIGLAFIDASADRLAGVRCNRAAGAAQVRETGGPSPRHQVPMERQMAVGGGTRPGRVLRGARLRRAMVLLEAAAAPKHLRPSLSLEKPERRVDISPYVLAGTRQTKLVGCHSVGV